MVSIEINFKAGINMKVEKALPDNIGYSPPQ